MKRLLLLLNPFIFVLAFTAGAQMQMERDVIETSSGDLGITFVGHGTLMFEYGGQVIHVDPWGGVADYSALPKADIILVTHGHGDHFDPGAIQLIRLGNSQVIVPARSAGGVDGAIVMKNGEVRTIGGVKIEAVPAYNLVHMRSEGVPFHPKGEGNGYILTFGDKRIYVAGDTENIAEMKQLKNIDIAFLPMNLPYTMTPEMVADAVRAFKPKILYPYHFGDTDTSQIVNLLKDVDGVEVRIRKMQ